MVDSVVGLIEREKRFLLGKRVVQPGHPLSGKWHVPGGKLKKGERKKQGLKRELKEETSLEVKIGRCFGEGTSATGRTVYWFLCEPTNGHRPRAGSDVTEVRYYTARQVLQICAARIERYWPEEAVEYLRTCARGRVYLL